MPVFAVTTARGPRWDDSRGIRAQDEWEPHAAYMDKLLAGGTIILGGPIGGAQPDEIALLAMQGDSAEGIRSAFDADPWVIAGVLRIASVRPWTIWLDSRQRARRGPRA